VTVDAILPAGGRIAGDSAAEAGTDVKALIEIDGHKLIDRAISELRAVDAVDRIVVIGPTDLAGCAADVVLPERDTGPGNIFRGLDWLGENRSGAKRVLILTTDLPVITTRAINGFLDACPNDVDICVPVIRREEFETQFPGCTSTYVKLKGGDWTLGCAFLVDPNAVAENRTHIERIFNARKGQPAMARLLGPLMIARFMTRRLEIRHIEDRCRRIMGCSGAAVLGCDPALAFDIEEVRDLRYARNRASASISA
jgi:hypothetical protein